VALPGGRKFLFFIRSAQPDNNGIYLGSVDGSAKPVRVLTSLSSGLYSPPHGEAPGRLLWVRDRSLLAQAFDPETGALSGDVATLTDDVWVEESQRGTFASVAGNGTLVCASARAADIEMVAVDRSGQRVESLKIPVGKIVQPTISPDDRTLAFTRATGGTADIWTYNLASKEVRQLTTDPDYDEVPEWSPDSARILYQGRRNGDAVVLIASIGGGKTDEVVVSGSNVSASTFLRDGRATLVTRAAEGDIALVKPGNPPQFVSLTSDPGYEAQPRISPDGRWIAFISSRSGQGEVVVADFDDTGATVTIGSQRVPVSSGGGGVSPHWRKDGKEIIYSAPNNQVMAVSVAVSGKTITLGRPTPLPISPVDVGGSGANWTANSTHTLFVYGDVPRASRQTFRVIVGK
jgi:WD40 repeat protein